MKQARLFDFGKFKLFLAALLIWLPYVLLTAFNQFIWLPARQKLPPVLRSRPTPSPNSSCAVPEPALIACVNCSSRQHATTTALRALRRVPPPPSGAADLWAYPNLYRDSYMSTTWPQIAIFVATSPERREQRTAIRETWGRESSYPKNTVRLVFFMNMLPGKNLEAQIEAEVKTHNDLVVQPVGSLASLSSLMTEWMTTKIFSTPLVLVLRRDDCFVNVRALLANADRLIRESFDVAGRRRDATSPRALAVGDARRSTAEGNDVTKKGVKDTDGEYRRGVRDRNVAVDLAPFDPCALLLKGYSVSRRLQTVWAWFDSNASFADESFFSGRIAFKANLSVAHMDAVEPCDGERLWSTFRRNGSVTSCGHPVARIRAVHNETVQRLSNITKRHNETTPLLEEWKSALRPQRIR